MKLTNQIPSLNSYLYDKIRMTDLEETFIIESTEGAETLR